MSDDLAIIGRVAEFFLNGLRAWILQGNRYTLGFRAMPTAEQVGRKQEVDRALGIGDGSVEQVVDTRNESRPR